MKQTTDIPRHIAIIMDGNGRWAKSRGLERSYGHAKGVDVVKMVIEQSFVLGVEYLTLYAFSSENWSRPIEEVEGLMELFCATIVDQKDTLRDKGVKVLFMGEREELSEKVVKNIELCEQATSQNDKLTLVIALNYSSRKELVYATKQILNSASEGVEIDEKRISDNLYIPSLPDIDLLIRTSGECRLSNFMLWQASYSELYFTEVLWPDFNKKDYLEAINSFSKRIRRFGNI